MIKKESLTCSSTSQFYFEKMKLIIKRMIFSSDWEMWRIALARRSFFRFLLFYSPFDSYWNYNRVASHHSDKTFLSSSSWWEETERENHSFPFSSPQTLKKSIIKLSSSGWRRLDQKKFFISFANDDDDDDVREGEIINVLMKLVEWSSLHLFNREDKCSHNEQVFISVVFIYPRRE